MKLGWFSPVPPAQSEIAAHTSRLASGLRSTFDVDFWADGLDVGQHPEFGRDIDECDLAALNAADINIYNLGNHAPAHAAIFERSLQRPGIVVIHDTYLRHFFAGLCLQKSDNWKAFAALFDAQYGARGLRAARHFLESAGGHIEMDLGGAEIVALGSIGVVVHSRAAEQAMKQSGLPVCYLPLPYASSPTNAARLHTASPHRLVMCGHMGHNRCLPNVLDALAALSSQQSFHLDLFGNVPPVLGVTEQIRKLRLESRVTLHGFVSEQVLLDALNAADLAINLRNPSMGEASASQLRFWNHALPTLVSRTGWYAEQPDETVCFVRPSCETEDIQHHLDRYLRSPAEYRACGKAGKRHLATNHAPAAYVAGLERFVNEVREGEAEGEALKIADRVGATLAGWQSRNGQLLASRGAAATLLRVFRTNETNTPAP